MKIFLVVFFLVGGQWEQGEAGKGWGPVPYESMVACQASKARAKDIHEQLKKVNARAMEKRFECLDEAEITNKKPVE